jgi:hypothetical protein
MATPFGVYLTTGAFGAGVGPLALISTGALMFLLFVVSAVASTYLAQWASSTAYGNALVPPVDAVSTILFLVGLRLLPLAGIHAAEHKVVHAIERGEELVPEVVQRMPRVHPRCGTNLAAGLGIFGAVSTTPYIPDADLRFIAAALLTLVFWRPLGNLLQFVVTTRPPNAKQVEMGIRSGKALLEKYRVTRGTPPNVWQRLWNSGMPYVLVGSSLCYGACWLVDQAFHLHIVT